MYRFRNVGVKFTTTNRVFIESTKTGLVSPWHDIPLYALEENKVVNMVVEIPRWSNAKMEIDKSSPLNPIKQDTKNGKLRFVHNIFPFRGYIWNYGAIPQTWEDPNVMNSDTKCVGDDDPLDICEIGSKVCECGEICSVKVLGVLCLLDQGETDWKVIGIRTDDPMAPKMNDIGDVELLMPGLLSATHTWFRDYKKPDGKPANMFGFDGKFKDPKYALKVIMEAHESWKGLLRSPILKKSNSMVNTTLEGNYFEKDVEKYVDAAENSVVAETPSEGDPMWYFVN